MDLSKKTFNLNEEEEEETSEYYEWVMIPHVASEEKKTGVTFKGSDDEYFKAHKIILEMLKKKGDRFVVNETEIAVADAPENKPVTVEVKYKAGRTGKAQLKIFGKNNKGIGTIMVTKISGADMIHVRNLAFKVVKYMLDNIISGEIGLKILKR